MKKISTILLVLLGLSAWSQKARTQYGEYGLGLSTLNMSSDISDAQSVNSIFNEMRPQLTVFGKYHFNDWFGMGAEMSYGLLYANDANHSNFERGLEVNTNLFHSNAFMEAHLIRFGKYRLARKFSLYLKAGAGVAVWDPQVNVPDQIDEDIELYEGAYSGISYFGGFGTKFRTSYKSVLTIEARFHNSGGNTLDGFIDTSAPSPDDNDTFWGVLFSYSILVF